MSRIGYHENLKLQESPVPVSSRENPHAASSRWGNITILKYSQNSLFLTRPAPKDNFFFYQILTNSSLPKPNEPKRKKIFNSAPSTVTQRWREKANSNPRPFLVHLEEGNHSSQTPWKAETNQGLQNTSSSLKSYMTSIGVLFNSRDYSQKSWKPWVSFKESLGKPKNKKEEKKGHEKILHSHTQAIVNSKYSKLQARKT